MKHIFDAYEEPKKEKKKRTSERAELIGEFESRVNQGRERDGYKKLQARTFAVLLAHVSTGDLYYLKKQCAQSRSYSATFFSSIKIPKHGRDDKHTGGAPNTEGKT